MTRNDAHTPGPWTCRPTEDGAYALNPSGVGWLRCSKDETWANARLIAAAPDLLAACELFTQAAHEVRDLLNARGFACPASIAFAAEHARNAIAKAEGR